MKCKQCNTKEVTKYPKAQLCVTCYASQDSKKLTLKDGRWSKYSDKCKECKKDTVQHQAWGFCNTCYMRQFRKLKSTGISLKKTLLRVKGIKKPKQTRVCVICGTNKRLYCYSGTELPVCFPHFQQWRQTVPCDGCGKPCLENAIETENDNILYWWHYPCWERACSTTQIEQLKALASAL